MGIWSWWKRRPAFDADDEDIREEIRAHLAIAREEKIADGIDPEDARYAAMRELGNVTRVTEATRSVWTPRWLDMLRELLTDMRYALRTLAKNPAFALTVVAVLTLGIGLNAAVFTMLKGFALRPIAGVNNSSHIAVIHGETSSGRPIRLSYPDYQFLRDHNDAFASLAGSAVATLNLGRGRGARQVWAEIVTGNYFQAHAVQAQLGRTLLPTDERATGAHPVVVLSDAIWRRDFAADPSIVGKTIEVNNYVLTVVGVTDPTFHGTIVSYDVELFIPVMMAPQLGLTFGSQSRSPAGILADRRAMVFYPQGFLRPGISFETAAAQTDALWATLDRDRSANDVAQRLRIVPFWKMPGSAPTFILPSLTVLTVMGLLVLTIACANIAGLVLVRGVSRRGEIAVRLALGATRARIVRLLVAENLVLAVPGALLGVLFASNALPILVGYAEMLASPQRVFFNLQLDGYVIAFTVAAACLSALVFGVMPSLQSSRVDLVSVINEDASPRGAARGCLRSSLVVAQVAVSLLLLVGAGLTLRTTEAARATHPGFERDAVIGVELDVKQNGYDPTRGKVFYRALLERVRAEAAVESATLAAYEPLQLLDTRAQPVVVEGYAARQGEDMAFMSNAIESDYFRTLGIPLLAGREFTDRDDDQSALVAIVNKTLAERFWSDANTALGKRIRLVDGVPRTIVGVAADIKYARVNEGPRPYFYVPFRQAYRPLMVMHVRAAAGAPLDRLIEMSRGHIEALDREMPILSAAPMTWRTRGSLIFFDLTAMMLFIFGVAGMALAALGTYGLVAYAVKQSAHEIGIRIALGASTASVVRQFIARGMRLGIVGAIVGTIAALGATQMLSNVLFGVSATDLASYARALAIVLGGVLVATLVPARRAARTSPLHLLRHQ